MSDINEVIRRVLDLDREATGGPWAALTRAVADERLPGSVLNDAGYVIEAADCLPALVGVDAPGEDTAGPDAHLIAEYRTAAPELARALVAEQGRVADLERQLAAAVDERNAEMFTARNCRIAADHAADARQRVERERDALRAELQAANARADEWQAKAQMDPTGLSRLLWRDEYKGLAETNREHMQERDALRTDLARVTAERDEAREGESTMTHFHDLALIDRRTALDEAAAARQDAEALRGAIAELAKSLWWCRHTISNANEILRDEDEEDTAEVDAELVEIDALLAKHALPAPPAPAPAPDLAFGANYQGWKHAIAADGCGYTLAHVESSVPAHQWRWSCPDDGSGRACGWTVTEAEAIAAANAHNRQRLAGVK